MLYWWHRSILWKAIGISWMDGRLSESWKNPDGYVGMLYGKVRWSMTAGLNEEGWNARTLSTTQAVKTAEDKINNDKACKKILASEEILAYILKGVVPEYGLIYWYCVTNDI